MQPTPRSGSRLARKRSSDLLFFLARFGLPVAVVLLSGCVSRAAAEPCPNAISPETARRVFERMQALQVASGYRFDGIESKETLHVQWSLDGNPCPTISAGFGSCEPPSVPTLQLRVPDDFLSRCPGLGIVVDELSKAVHGEQPAAPLTQPANAAPSSRWPTIVVIVAVAAFTLTRYLQAPVTKSAFGWTGLLQIVFALLAANVLFLRDRTIVDAQLLAAWVVLAILLIERDRRPRASGAFKVAMCALFAFSLLVHWAFSYGGPGDANLNLHSLWSTDFDFWGQSPIALLGGVHMVTGELRDTHIVWCNLILSSLVPILMFQLVVALGLGRGAAMCAAFIVAAHPLLIVFSGVLERQPMYLFAACGSLLALIRFLERDSWARFVAVVLGTILAITCRPEGAHLVVLQLAVVLVLPATRRARGVAISTIVLLAALGLIYAQRHARTAPGGGSFAEMVNPAPFLWTILCDPDFTPLAWIATWIVGVLVSLRHRAGLIVVMSLLGFHILWQWTGVYEMFVGIERQVASARYETILLIPFTIGIALFFEKLAVTRRAAQVGGIVLIVLGTILTFGRTYDVLLRPFTIDYEYHFLKRHASTLPPQSVVQVMNSPEAEGFTGAIDVGKFVGSEVRFSNVTHPVSSCDDTSGAEPYVYIGSACAALVDMEGTKREQWIRDCGLIRNQITADAVEEIDVPARKFTWHEFANPTVRLGLYRIREASNCAS